MGNKFSYSQISTEMNRENKENKENKENDIIEKQEQNGYKPNSIINKYQVQKYLDETISRDKKSKLIISQLMYGYINEYNDMIYNYYKDKTDTVSIIMIGKCYLNGIGVQIDHKKAIEKFEEAIKLGDANGYTKVGECYYNGTGVDIDYNKAKEYFEFGEKYLDSDAINCLGNYYLEGKAESENIDKAYLYFSEAAEYGNSYGYKNIAKIHYYNANVKVKYNSDKIIEAYQKSILLGNIKACTNLGDYFLGQGKVIEAYEYFKKASYFGCKNAKKRLNEHWYREYILKDKIKELEKRLDDRKLFQEACKGKILIEEAIITSYL